LSSIFLAAEDIKTDDEEREASRGRAADYDTSELAGIIKRAEPEPATTDCRVNSFQDRCFGAVGVNGDTIGPPISFNDDRMPG
jgi:hypothetical protein